MQNTHKAMNRMIEIEDEACGQSIIHKIHPLTKLLVTVAFLGFLISYERYDATGVFVMGIYPLMVFSISGVSVSGCVKRIWPIFPVFAMFGIFNIFTDTLTAFTLFQVHVSYGIISFFVLLLKGILALLGGYLLIATTGIENLCYGLSILHVPRVLLTQILLTYRYLSLLLEQAGELHTAYRLRAPGKQGIHPRVWASMVGQLLLRTIDRGQIIYESMLLRGYDGSFHLKRQAGKSVAGIGYLLIWMVLFFALRIYDITTILGSLILGW